jgi:hypothetical protein
MRDISRKMVEYIDKKIKGNGLAEKAIKDMDARTLMGVVADSLVGICEEGGNNKGPLVEMIQETIGEAQGEAWCMSFVQTVIAYCELRTGTVSPIFESEHCMTVWNKTPKKQRVKLIPAANAIAIWNYPPSANGHTGIVRAYFQKAKKMNLVEGNAEAGLSKDGTIERNGGGVYFTERSIASSKKMVLVGFLKPF